MVMTPLSRNLLAALVLLPAPVLAGETPLRLRHDGAVYGVAFSPEGRALITAGADGIIRVWDVASGRQKKGWNSSQGAIYALALSADGKTLATGGSDSTVRLWDMATEKETARLTGHKGDVEGLALSRDGRFLAASSSGRSGRFRTPKDGLFLG
jgi:WD40 repeat protein